MATYPYSTLTGKGSYGGKTSYDKEISDNKRNARGRQVAPNPALKTGKPVTKKPAAPAAPKKMQDRVPQSFRTEKERAADRAWASKENLANMNKAMAIEKEATSPSATVRTKTPAAPPPRNPQTSVTGGMGFAPYNATDKSRPTAKYGTTPDKGTAERDAKYGGKSAGKPKPPAAPQKPSMPKNAALQASGGLGFQAYNNTRPSYTASTGVNTSTKTRNAQYGERSFGQAFKDAQSAGLASFKYGGKDYNTKLRGAPASRVAAPKKNAPTAPKKAVKPTNTQVRTTKAVAKPAAPKAAPRNNTNASKGGGNTSSRGMTPAMKASMGV